MDPGAKGFEGISLPSDPGYAAYPRAGDPKKPLLFIVVFSAAHGPELLLHEIELILHRP